MSQQKPMGTAPQHAFDRRVIPARAKESRWAAFDGQPIRRIDWPVPAEPCRGSILFMPGRADFYEKYLETLDGWNCSLWQVTAADWRGQGGSGRFGNDAVTGHIDDFSIWVRDLEALWTEWKSSTPGPHVLAAHSMGGHLALRSLAEGKLDPDALILCAPMLGFQSSRLPNWFMQAAAWLMTKLGDPRRPAWKWDEVPGKIPPERERLLTHDAARYGDELFWRKARPELVMGPGSWGWVERSYASMRKLAKPGLLEAIKQPVLLLGSDNDKLVSFAAIARAAKRLRRGELLCFGAEARHEILREEDGVRTVALTAIDDFLDRNAPLAG